MIGECQRISSGKYYRIGKLENGSYAVFVWKRNIFTGKTGFVQYSDPFKHYDEAAKCLDDLMGW